MRLSAIVMGLCLASWALLAPPSMADIAAYNAAMLAGDYRAASTEAKAIWPGFDKTRSDTAVIAREFGFASYMAGDYAAARDFGLFLKSEGARLPTPDDQPATSAVLLAVAQFRLDPRPSRDALFEALSSRAAAPGVDSISVLAAELLYRSDWAMHAMPAAIRSSQTAATLLSRAGPGLKPRVNLATLTGAAADFLDGPTRDDFGHLADIHDIIVADLDATTEPRARQALVEQMFQARAWVAAATAWFASQDQVGSHIARGPRDRELRTPRTPVFTDSAASTRPLCAGRMDTANFEYPLSALFRGAMGAVIIRFTTDETGAVTNARILASVPAEVFAEALVAASPRFRWRPERSADRSACTLATTDKVMTFQFVVG
jgi:TonB family protein